MSTTSIASTCTAADQPVDTPLWLQQGGLIPVLLGIAAMFWAISFVCEEYGVPSLAAFCKRNRLSDALTGSIFIGTGLSLPVFFIAVAGLFASNSAIGVGAVVGGNLFNHLFTIASSIFVCPGRVMKLDPVVFSREMLIYFLTCILVLWTVSEGKLSFAFNSSFDSNQWASCLSISWKYSTALVVSYIVYCIIDANFYYAELFVKRWWLGLPSTTAVELQQFEEFNELEREDGAWGALVTDLTHIHINDLLVPGRDSNSQLTAEAHAETSSTDMEQGSTEAVKSPSENSSITSDLYVAMTKANEEITVEDIKTKSMMDSAFDQGDRYLEILKLPSDSNLLQKLFFYMTFPLRLAIFITTPDVRRPGSEKKAILSMFVSVLWLAVLSYVLTVALTLIGNWWRISSAVMGITIAAWASNFPAHWSSMVVSRHGFGDVSCCNCLGSNIFNNLIGLGLPWLLYSIVYKGNPYEALGDDGVAISVFCMMITIVVHYIVVWASNWVLREWMIAPMLAMYLVEIGFLCYFYSAMV